MVSPVLFDKEFVLTGLVGNSFVDMGPQRGNRGLQHIVYVKKIPATDKFTVGENIQINGYCHCRYLFQFERIVGVLFCAFSYKTKLLPYMLSIANYSNLPDTFEPKFSLENLGLLMFISNDSSLIVLPKIVSHNDLLVKDE